MAITDMILITYKAYYPWLVFAYRYGYIAYETINFSKTMLDLIRRVKITNNTDASKEIQMVK